MSSMTAKGKITHKALIKYGSRADVNRLIRHQKVRPAWRGQTSDMGI
ncbi:MAG: hypothetical protein LW875_01055 [Proteobacteria bacterium]|nr:hypothetical protein [Pseudomonadota bacterium]